MSPRTRPTKQKTLKKKRRKTYRSQIHRQLPRLAPKPIPQRRHVTPHYQENDAGVVELVPPLGHLVRVVANRMVRRAHPQAQEGAREKAGKHQDVGRGGGVKAGVDQAIQVCGQNDGKEGAEEVRPDVD